MATQLSLFGEAELEAAEAQPLRLPNSPGLYLRPEVEPPDISGRGFYDYNLGLIACSKSKLNHPAPARDFYTGALFRKARAYCERVCTPTNRVSRPTWYVLSAKYGLVHPDQVLEPYEETLNTASAEQRSAWGRRVLEQFRESPGTRHVWQFLLLAGRAYWESLPSEFFTWGTHSLPLKGCRGLGEQLARLDKLVSEWDFWRAPGPEAKVQPLELPGWEAAVYRSTLWVREKAGPWRGPFHHAKGSFRCGHQYSVGRGDTPWRDGGWTGDIPAELYRGMRRLFPEAEQRALLEESQVARRGRKRRSQGEART